MSARAIEPTPSWDGKGLPPVGMDVLIDTNSSGLVMCTVTGYHVEGHLEGDTAYHRVFVDVVYKGTDAPNCRLLRDVKPVPPVPPEQWGKFFMCDFCNKTQEQVEKIIAGERDTAICNECIDLCNQIIAEHNAAKEKA
jgi:hypothetical protein